MQNYFVFNEAGLVSKETVALHVSATESNAKIWHGNYDFLSAPITLDMQECVLITELAFLEDRFRVAYLMQHQFF